MTPLLGVITDDGRFKEDVTAPSGDKKVEINIPKNTIGMNRAGSLISSIIIEVEQDRPAPPSDTKVIGEVYNIKPDGAVFDPPVTLMFEYDPDYMPEGTSGSNFVISKWILEEARWVDLESVADPENNTVSTEIGGFSIYALVAHTRPASFSAAELTVTPDEAEPGENVSVSVLVTNSGDLAGTHEVVLNIDGAVKEKMEATLEGGASATVSFDVTFDEAGEHNISVDGISASCNIREVKAPASFRVSGLSISPSTIYADENVSLGLTVTNEGDLPGSYAVTLTLDGEEVETREVALEGGESREITFTVNTEQAGTHSIDINGLTGEFEVEERVEEAAAPAPAPAPEVAPEPITEPEPARSTNWWLIGGTSLLVSGCLVFYIIFRKRLNVKNGR
jgi:hypothetical protein